MRRFKQRPRKRGTTTSLNSHIFQGLDDLYEYDIEDGISMASIYREFFQLYYSSKCDEYTIKYLLGYKQYTEDFANGEKISSEDIFSIYCCKAMKVDDAGIVYKFTTSILSEISIILRTGKYPIGLLECVNLLSDLEWIIRDTFSLQYSIEILVYKGQDVSLAELDDTAKDDLLAILSGYQKFKYLYPLVVHSSLATTLEKSIAYSFIYDIIHGCEITPVEMSNASDVPYTLEEFTQLVYLLTISYTNICSPILPIRDNIGFSESVSDYFRDTLETISGVDTLKYGFTIGILHAAINTSKVPGLQIRKKVCIFVHYNIWRQIVDKLDNTKTRNETNNIMEYLSDYVTNIEDTFVSDFFIGFSSLLSVYNPWCIKLYEDNFTIQCAQLMEEIGEHLLYPAMKTIKAFSKVDNTMMTPKTMNDIVTYNPILDKYIDILRPVRAVYTNVVLNLTFKWIVENGGSVEDYAQYNKDIDIFIDTYSPCLAKNLRLCEQILLLHSAAPEKIRSTIRGICHISIYNLLQTLSIQGTNINL